MNAVNVPLTLSFRIEVFTPPTAESKAVEPSTKSQ